MPRPGSPRLVLPLATAVVPIFIVAAPPALIAQAQGQAPTQAEAQAQAQADTQVQARAREPEPDLIPREALFGNPERTAPQLSPDGTRLAYLAPDSGVMNVWVRTLVGPADDRPVTRERRRPIQDFAWQGDSRHVLYLHDRDGDENRHLYQTDVDSLDTRDLTPFDGVQARVVTLDPNHPKAMVVALNRRDPRLHDAYRLDLVTGALKLEAENPGDVLEWTTDNRLRVRVAQAVLDGGTIEYRLRYRPGTDTPWYVFRSEGPGEMLGRAVGFTADNQRLLLLSGVHANTLRLFEVDITTGASRTVASDPEFDIRAVLRHPRRHTVQAVNVVRHASTWDLVDSTLDADLDKLRAVRAGEPSVVSRDLADRQWVVRYDAFEGPAWYYLYDRVTGTSTPLFADRPALSGYPAVDMRPFTFRGSDGMTIHGFLTLPPGKEPRNLPLVMLVHDGPWSRDAWGYDPRVQLLANRGYAVLQIDFRGSSGYGRAYLDAGDREWGGMILIDLLDGKNWAVDQGYVDPARTCIWGEGFGGYAALMVLTFTPDDFRCGIDVAGPTNLVSLWQGQPPYATAFRYEFARRVGEAETDPGFLNEQSPLGKVSDITAPLLVAHGANDPWVPRFESDTLVAALRANGKTVQYLVFEDEGHDLVKPENRLRFYAAAEAFLAQHLGGRAEPAAAQAVRSSP